MFDNKCVHLFHLILLFVLSFSLNLCETNDENIVSVRLKSGLINGKIETSVEGQKLNVFRGIPYAQPPVGQLRFKKPLPLEEWPQTLDAYEWPNACYQNLWPNIKFLNHNLSEDCLYLNIWTPIDSLNDIELKPVIFYIHGGALIIGSSTWQDLTGEVISAKGDVIFVSINYRLSTFGFLYTGRGDAPGNVGLWDQALALEWVNDNIKYFGGDPSRITIMGMSAGSWSTSLHVLSPITRNLYQNAVLQSGAYVDGLIEDKTEYIIKKWLKASQIIGCNEDKSESFNSKIMDCLRSAEPSTLAKIPEMPEIKDISIRFFPLVVVDGQFLPEKPSQLFRSGDFKQNVNLLMSTTADEGSFLLMFENIQKYSSLNTSIQSLNEAITELTDLSSKMSKQIDINGKEVAKHYFMGVPDNNDFGLYLRTIGIALGDYYLLCPTILFGKEVFKNSHFKSNVYQYYFSVKFGVTPHWWGSSHGEDRIPTHGLPFLHQDNYSEDDRQLSAKMIQFITDFAKQGAPTPQSGTDWPKFYTIDDNIIAPFYEITKQPKPETNFGVGLKITECEYLWKKYLFP